MLSERHFRPHPPSTPRCAMLGGGTACFIRHDQQRNPHRLGIEAATSPLPIQEYSIPTRQRQCAARCLCIRAGNEALRGREYFRYCPLQL